MEQKIVTVPNRDRTQGGADRKEILRGELEALLSMDEPLITLFSNAAAFIYDALDRLNWAGFYFLKGDSLFLGPFIGKPACTRIENGKGVCGASVIRREVLVVDDVDAFPGHIACDSASRSEIVLPLILASGRVLGVLDVDSPDLERFSIEERALLEALRDVIVSKLDRMVSLDEAIFV